MLKELVKRQQTKILYPMILSLKIKERVAQHVEFSLAMPEIQMQFPVPAHAKKNSNNNNKK